MLQHTEIRDSIDVSIITIHSSRVMNMRVDLSDVIEITMGDRSALNVLLYNRAAVPRTGSPLSGR